VRPAATPLSDQTVVALKLAFELPELCTFSYGRGLLSNPCRSSLRQPHRLHTGPELLHRRSPRVGAEGPTLPLMPDDADAGSCPSSGRPRAGPMERPRTLHHQGPQQGRWPGHHGEALGGDRTTAYRPYEIVYTSPSSSHVSACPATLVPGKVSAVLGDPGGGQNRCHTTPRCPA
jgi:hypothetical protein